MDEAVLSALWGRSPSPISQLSFEFEPDRGHLIRAGDGFGLHLVAPGGGSVHSTAPEAGTEWRWRRLFFGQVLPLVALIHGRAVLHASAVTRDGLAIALSGGSGSGKSSIAAALLERGCDPLTDDCLALDPDGAWSATAGPAVLVLPGDFPRLAGRPSIDGIDRRGDELHARVRPSAATARVGHFVRLERGGARELRVEPMDDPAPALLSAGFAVSHGPPGRLATHLEACAAMAADARVLRVASPHGTSPETIADAVLAALER